VDPNLQAGMALFKALDLYGLKYVIDPKTPFVELSQAKSQVDYLQFPRQTLEFRAGDCDDLSILYCALLESIGVETAFVTVPGHIFAAFRLETQAKEAPRDFTNTADLVLHDAEVWVPVEVTERREGFLRAWQEGAREWREATSKKTAGFYPVHEAWTIYEPVGLPGGGTELTMPSSDSILAAYLQEMIRFVDREIYPKVSRLEQEIGSGTDTPASRNRLGILYAKYGKWDKAEQEFLQVLSKGEYSPALVNLGNLHYQKKDYDRARHYYERAAALDPKSATVQLCLARVYHEQEQYELARASYESLKRADAGLAERFAYLGGGDSGTARAGESSARRETVLWSE
jgi:tetratricopeptide (TPR) repeat protein